MKVSIVIPVYNVIDYIDECLESVIKQSYKNLEIILVNDGSTDGSDLICQKYASDTRVKLINQANQGLSAARNVGIRESSGEFLIFLDSDDYLDSDVILTMVNEIDNSSIDILVTGYTTKISNKLIESYSPDALILDGTHAMYEVLKCNVPHVAWGKMYRKSVYKNINFPVGKMCEDLSEISLSFGRAKNIKFIPLSTLVYRRRAGSIMHSYKKELFIDSFYVYGLLEKAMYELYDPKYFMAPLDTKYLKIIISNINLALRAKDLESAIKISDLLREKNNKRNTKHLSFAYKTAYYMVKHVRPLYFHMNELLINKLKYKFFKVN